MFQIEMKRRRFLQASGAAAAVLFLEARSAVAGPVRLPAGIQLYAVREPLAKDTPGTLKALKSIGFEEVESAGTSGHTAKEFRAMLDDAGLKLPSAHLDFHMDNDVGPVLAEANALGVQFAVSSFLRKLNDPGRMSLGNTTVQQSTLAPMGADGFAQMAARMNEIGRAAKAAGLEYAYHNHNFEFEKLPDGSLGYDLLLRKTDPALVKFELDCGWMVVAGASPVEYFRRYPGRIRMIHVKDFQPTPATTDMVGPGRPKGVELGRGFIDYRPIFAEARKAGVEHAFAEQEAPYIRSQLESAQVSFDYLKAMGAG